MAGKEKIDLYLDGPTLQEIEAFKNVDGYTFNPSLYKKLKVTNYIKFTKELINKTNNRPISIEVIANDDKNCTRQGEILSKLSNNVYVKIPVIFSLVRVVKKRFRT